MRRARISLGLLLCAAGSVRCRYWDVQPLFDDARAERDGALDSANSDASDVAARDGSSEDGAIDAASDGPASDQCLSHRAQITEGVGAIDVRNYLFSPIAVHGARACPVLVTPSGRPFAAVTEDGAGRVVWLGHDGIFQLIATQRDVAPLLRNAITWAARRAAREARVGVSPETLTGTLPAFFAQEGIDARSVSARNLLTSGVDVWVVFSTTAPSSASDQQIVREYLRAGGSLVLAGQAWNWARSHPGESLEAYPGNALLSSAGLTMLTEALSTADTTAGATTAVPAVSHAITAVEALGSHARGELALPAAQRAVVASVLRDAARATPIDAPFWLDVRGAIDGLSLALASSAAPLRPGVEQIDASVHRLVGRINADGPVSWINRVDGAEQFPGTTARSVETVTVTIDGDAAPDEPRWSYAASGARHWRSTGLYARPGETLTIRVSNALVSAQLGVRIGAHDRDADAESSWRRPPRVSREQRITSATSTIGSVFGGLVYVTVAPGSSLGAIDVQVSGAVRAPSFGLARDRGADAAWAQAARESDVPWLELQGEHVSITAPTEAARAVVSPTQLVEYWDAVQRALDDFAGVDSVPRRVERVVFDPLVLDGLLVDSGYPNVRPYERLTAMLTLDALRTSGDWGGYFALARMVQSRDWTVAGSQDAVVNVLVLYALEQVTGVALGAPPLPELAASARSARITAYIAGGRDFANDWNGLTALETYLQLVEGFGWAPLRQCVREIAALPASERPTTADARLQQWVLRSSRCTSRDLSAFYLRWGWPVSAATRAATAAWPAWSDAPARP